MTTNVNFRYFTTTQYQSKTTKFFVFFRLKYAIIYKSSHVCDQCLVLFCSVLLVWQSYLVIQSSWSTMQVFRHLIEKVNCRLLFATHYHPLTKEFASHPHVSLQHMSCAMRPTSSSGKDFDLVFLYRLASGACPASYGLQVALMAGIPKQVVEAASTASEAMKEMIGASFKSSEQRSEFSTLHEQWFKTILSLACEQGNFDDDTYDSLFCLWHELKTSYRKSLAPV